MTDAFDDKPGGLGPDLRQILDYWTGMPDDELDKLLAASGRRGELDALVDEGEIPKRTPGPRLRQARILAYVSVAAAMAVVLFTWRSLADPKPGLKLAVRPTPQHYGLYLPESVDRRYVGLERGHGDWATGDDRKRLEDMARNLASRDAEEAAQILAQAGLSRTLRADTFVLHAVAERAGWLVFVKVDDRTRDEVRSVTYDREMNQIVVRGPLQVGVTVTLPQPQLEILESGDGIRLDYHAGYRTGSSTGTSYLVLGFADDEPDAEALRQEIEGNAPHPSEVEAELLAEWMRARGWEVREVRIEEKD